MYMICPSLYYPEIKIHFTLQRNPLTLEFWWSVRLSDRMKEHILDLPFQNTYAYVLPQTY